MNNIDEITKEIENSTDKQLRAVIEQWFEKIHTQSMKLGAQFISAAVAGAIDKNLKNGYQSSLRDYQRAIKRVLEIVSVQLKQQETQQNNLELPEEDSV